MIGFARLGLCTWRLTLIALAGVVASVLVSAPVQASGTVPFASPNALVASPLLPQSTVQPAVAGPQVGTIRCGGLRNPASAFTVAGSGGYVGPAMSGSCDGSFSFVLTPTTAKTTWPVFTDFANTTQQQARVQPWVYIPNVDAGAVVDYTFFDCNGNQVGKAQGVNQEALTGWTTNKMPAPVLAAGQHLCIGNVVLGSGEQVRLDMAEDALGFTFFVI